MDGAFRDVGGVEPRGDLFCGCGIEGMRNLPQGSVDAILTDPPYGYMQNYTPYDRRVPDAEAFSEAALRALRPGGFVVFSGRGPPLWEIALALKRTGFDFYEEVVWDKGQGTSPAHLLQRTHELFIIMGGAHGVRKPIRRAFIPYLEGRLRNPNSMQRDTVEIRRAVRLAKEEGWAAADADFETAFAAALRELEELREKHRVIEDLRGGNPRRGTITLGSYERYPHRSLYEKVRVFKRGFAESSIMRVCNPPPGRKGTFHPFCKPERLGERLLALVTDPGDLVCDPFMGSGSFGLAALRTGRSFVGFEIDPQAHRGAALRIEEFLNGMRAGDGDGAGDVPRGTNLAPRNAGAVM